MIWKTTILLFVIGLPICEGKVLSALELQKRLRSAVSNYLSEGVKVQIDSVHSEIAIPRGAKISVQTPQPPLGLVSFSATWHEGGERKTVGLKAVVRAFSKIAVLRQSVPHQSPLSPEMVAFPEKELGAYAVTGFFQSPEQLLKRQAKGYLRPGTILNANNTSLTPLIKRGERIEVVGGEKGLRASIHAIAMEDGHLGEWIKTQNIHSKRFIQARVSKPGEAKIN